MTLEKSIVKQITDLYQLEQVEISNLNTPTNEIFRIKSEQGNYALKIYGRDTDRVKWEIELLHHLIAAHLPIVRPIEANEGLVTQIFFNDEYKTAVLYEWLDGEKPKESNNFYHQLGEIAAEIHNTSDSFKSGFDREIYSLEYLVDEQIRRIEQPLKEVNKYNIMIDLGKKLKGYINNNKLDVGVCHMDLKPDNVHIHEGKLTVFDFDSAGICWRAIEPYRILEKSEVYFRNWLDGYRSKRNFGLKDELAVNVFIIIGNLRNAVWHLGFAESSKGNPTMNNKDLEILVDNWELRAKKLT